MATQSKNVGGALVYYDTHGRRLLDAFGSGVVKYIEDFVNPATVTGDAVQGWTTTLVEAGSGESTVTITDASGGALLLTTDNADNDGITLQLKGESFQFSSSQTATYFGIRLRSGEATQSDFLVGLCITDTDLLGGMTDGVYFRKVDGSTSVAFVTEKNSTETETTGVLTFVTATDYIFECYFDYATSTVYAFVNGIRVAAHTTNIPDDELLTPSIQFLTGNAAIETMQIDWVRAIQIGR